MQINSAKDLDVYKKAYELSMAIFRLSSSWPPEEKYSLTDTWLDYARDCNYISADQRDDLAEVTKEAGKMLGSMLKHPQSFLLTADR